MPSISYGQSMGRINQSVLRTGDGQADVDIDLPAGKDVTAWVKTDANTAACNLPGGHGYTDGNFDVYWSVAGVNYQRRNVPGTIATNALTLDGGGPDVSSGTDFPATATTDIVVCRQVAFNVAIDGDNAEIVGVCGKVAADVSTGLHVTFRDSAADNITILALVANAPNICDIAGGATNLYTGDPITNGVASNGNSTYAAVLQVSVLVDATP